MRHYLSFYVSFASDSSGFEIRCFCCSDYLCRGVAELKYTITYDHTKFSLRQTSPVLGCVPLCYSAPLRGALLDARHVVKKQ